MSYNAKKTLSDIFHSIPVLSVAWPAKPVAPPSSDDGKTGKAASIAMTVGGICIDSRKYRRGDLFVAIPGLHVDGHDYIPAVINLGCRIVIHSREIEKKDDSVCYIRVENPRRVLSPVSAALYDHPSKKLCVIGITGTDGKSSTVSYTFQLLRLLGLNAGFLSTVEYNLGTETRKNASRMSTPEAHQVQCYLKEMLENGVEVAVIESTSHGLSHEYNRLGDVAYNIAVLTNVSHEHLEFHGTIKKYAADKARMFSMLGAQGASKEACAILRAEEKFADVFLDRIPTGIPAKRYSSVSHAADLYGNIVSEDARGLHFEIIHDNKTYHQSLGLRGRFNLDNFMAAVLAVQAASGRSIGELLTLAGQIRPLKGRMEIVREGQDFSLIVDYAHSPGSFEKLFPLVKQETEGRLICVFGSAGERDREKRPEQGRIASRYADYIVLADEDPRGEDRLDILKEIAAGCEGMLENETLFLIPDRFTAIEKAVRIAGRGDTVMLLGKGHESSIEYADRSMEWDEAAVASGILKNLKK